MTKKTKKYTIRIFALAMGIGAAGGFFFENLGKELGEGSANADASFSRLNGAVKTNTEDYFDNKVVYKLPSSVSSSQEISVIVSMKADSVLDAYEASDNKRTVKEYVTTGEARATARAAERERNQLIKKLDKSGLKYELGEKYDTVLSGFEITIKAKDFEKANKILSSDATLIVGDVYAPAETQVITNDVDVYDTGIFDSSKSEYQGDGVVVAVLDTGLDYTHTAFSVDNFTTSEEAFTLSTIASKIGSTAAAKNSAGLTAEDVYVSRKVPYAYDYADKDADVAPISSEHGTHVAGVIAGKDETITGVAPNAQLAIMKVFSDTQTGAKTSWLLAALEDCVTLGVDVINMSLGSGCGFTREVDEKEVADVYDKVRAAGISLIASAANSYNATMSSEKNGNNGLTSNPDSGTVGSPSTYEAALSIASVDGVKTPYLTHNGDIIYFTEASTSDAQTKKSFVNDILKTVGEGVTEHDFEYVTIPGIGRSSDYMEEDEYYKGKIVLVKRGTSTFEEKVRVALKEKGAAGIIIYNNVSGNISMSVGANIGAVCSLSQDEGEKLAANKTGILKVSRSQAAGPFMSDFSSWGPTSDLKIKPEITAHGGEILSAVPGQKYERLSGTSMAAPNQAGATALIRQYVKDKNNSERLGMPDSEANDYNTEVTKRVNQLMMSTADIVMNKNGLPYAVRKQGSGLVNITKATTTAAYISTYNADGSEMDKTKLELGDDKKKTGVYEMTFAVNNITGSAISYNVDAVMITEGVSKTYTSHGDTTVTQEGYLLSGTQTQVVSVSGSGSANGNTVTVQANGSATVNLKITLSEADKQYLNESFENGMYVEGFVKLEAASGTSVSMNVPVLAFYGDWTKAPLFDEEYYDTNKDELNAGLDAEDKLMADAYATRVIGGLYSDYISTLGAYAFRQDPSATPIAANKEHIAISNQEGKNGSVNKIRSVTAGLLRNAKRVDISITDAATGREIYSESKYNVRKAFNNGGSIYGSSIDLDFGALENNLKNNSKYLVKMTSYIDYGADGEQKNKRNTFEFPLYIDFEAPIVTGVEYRTEYDSVTKKTQLFADVSIYDNHYTMGVSFGQIITSQDDEYLYTMKSFGKYITPVYSEFNTTSKVTIELTDFVSQITKDSLSVNNTNNNSFIASCYDYALNNATYEIRLPDEVLSMYFRMEEGKDKIELSPNETKPLSDVLNIFPNESWLETLTVTSSDPEYVDVLNQTIIAKKSGEAVLTATGYAANGKNKVMATATVKVLSEGDPGYVGSYSLQTVNKFELIGYRTLKASNAYSSSDKEVGEKGSLNSFGGNYELSMYPSESVQLQYELASYYPDLTKVEFTSSNGNVTVDENGVIVAQKDGRATITAAVTYNGDSTLHMLTVSVTIKEPFAFNSIYLNSYRGLGGEVVIPDDRGITTINAFAFSGYKLIEKDLSAGDVIDKESPYHTKQVPVGEDTITKIVIPEGVTTIEQYAFAQLTALEEVVLPSTLNLIGLGAFQGCTKLSKINLENVQFINERAFSGCNLQDTLSDGKVAKLVSVGNYAFENCKLGSVVLPDTAQSLGVGAFSNNKELVNVEFKAEKVKVGKNAFAGCTELRSVDINASVLSAYAFYGCTQLEKVRLGADVSVIGEYAFTGTKVAKFDVYSANRFIETSADGVYIYGKTNKELIVAAPKGVGETANLSSEIKSISKGAFSGNAALFELTATGVTSVGDYAFSDCTNLKKVTLGKLKTIGAYAFANTAITSTPDLSEAESIGKYAFALTKIVKVTLPGGVFADDYAFALNTELKEVEIGDGAVIGEAAFYSRLTDNSFEGTGKFNSDSYQTYEYEVKNETGATAKTYTYYSYNIKSGNVSALTSLTVGKNVTIGNYAFAGNAKLEKITWNGNGEGVIIGDYAFYNAASLVTADLSKIETIGEGAFSGVRRMDLRINENKIYAAYRIAMNSGEERILGNLYTSGAAQLAAVDLSNAGTLGKGAFAYNQKLTNLTLGDKLTAIADYAFAGATELASFAGATELALPENISEVGAQAFYSTKIASADLSKVDTIGTQAFAGTPLTSVVLKEGANIGDGAFALCDRLENVENLAKAVQIGAYAFRGTALETADLSAAKTIGDFAFALSAVKEVKFGKDLETLGENPFYGCEIASFGKTEDVTFGNQLIKKELNENYEISANVKVSNGVLYQKVPNGLELVSYPMLKTATDYTVETGTVRISAMAFAENKNIKRVTIAHTVKSLGDKAFYGCNNLSVAVFLGYNAPALEEEYDSSYASAENLPYNNGTSSVSISKYFMWNASASRGELFYYGATFVDRVGKTDKAMVMVRPANGQNYDSFIFGQYFSATIDGNTAATDATLNVIAMIENLPNITAADEATEKAVKAVREAYNLLSTEQQALVSNYSKLTDAETLIEYLKQQNPPAPKPAPAEDKSFKGGIIAIVIAATALAAGAVVTVCLVLAKKKKAAVHSEGGEPKESEAEESKNGNDDNE